MAEPSSESDSSERVAQPRSLRVVGWLSVVAGTWGVGDEISRAIGGKGVRWFDLFVDAATLVGGIGLVRRKRWGYLVTLASLVFGFVSGVWFFFIQGEYTLAGRLWGIPILLAVAFLLVVLLLPRARSWFKDGSRHA
jgi:uncharacterized membrane protein (UPF0136 family)